MKQGKLVVLNGGSSAGKTSTCKAFQNMADEHFIRMGIDRCWSAIPPKQMSIEAATTDYYKTETYYEDDLPYFHVTPGARMDATMLASYHSIAAYLANGINVISDQLFWKPKWLQGALTTWSPFHVFWVGVYVSDQEGMRREQTRGGASRGDTASGGRPDGWNRCSARVTHQGMVYDYEIDNTHLGIEETARKILDAFNENEAPTANSILYDRFNGLKT